MKLPFSWLKKLLPHSLESNKIAETLTQAGIEVDAIEIFNPPFTNVYSAKVIDIKKHPDADKLQVATVFDGQNNYQVVCGASNCRAGLIVAFAKPGAVLGSSDPLEIKERAVRGVHSQGMLCSLDELGLSKDRQEGIIEFEESFALGQDLKALLSDEIFEISITPNLGHVLSVVGIARELSAFLKLPMHLETQALKQHPHHDFHVEVKSDECRSYNLNVLKGLKGAKTPFMMQHHLRLAGFNPKNLSVDVLNYVMFERGLPMHSFDLSKLNSRSLKVENLHQALSFEALNGKSYSLKENLLVITSSNKICAAAGVMGSLDSACDDETCEIAIEAAHFTPSSVRRTIKHMDLRTDSANRFEKGVDQEGIVQALDYATALIMKYSHAAIESSFRYNHISPRKQILLNPVKTNRLLGTSLSSTEMKVMLERLEMQVEIKADDTLFVRIPSYRNDLNIQEDLIEEIGRLYGLDHLKGTLSYKATTINDDPIFTYQKALRQSLFGLGLQEVLTCDLLSPQLEKAFRSIRHENAESISVLHPRSIEQSTLRTSLLSSFIPVVLKNLSVKESNLSFFELGKVHAKLDHKFIEKDHIGILLSGKNNPYYFNPKPQDYDFYDLKGMIENLLNNLNIKDVSFKESKHHAFHPYQQTMIYSKDVAIGFMGQVHPEALRVYDIEQKVFFAELFVLELMQNKKHLYPCALPPTLPFIERDWTVNLEPHQSYQKLESEIMSHVPEYFESLELIDIYPTENSKNITVRLRYRSKDKSLESSQVDLIHQNFISAIAKKLQLSL